MGFYGFQVNTYVNTFLPYAVRFLPEPYAGWIMEKCDIVDSAFAHIGGRYILMALLKSSCRE
jgi:hypothetical protein